MLWRREDRCPSYSGDGELQCPTIPKEVIVSVMLHSSPPLISVVVVGDACPWCQGGSEGLDVPVVLEDPAVPASAGSSSGKTSADSRETSGTRSCSGRGPVRRITRRPPDALPSAGEDKVPFVPSSPAPRPLRPTPSWLRYYEPERDWA
ncbi:unnamed protein product [Pleuronectes platessa]|uniref:Uncharacterized protein n=1 Tax=Pleuronectes platessa TaxID=8262 RepID=A0A9N7VL06_PLEPL|nr:unnamed protein product [Pleuronectes platessa]